MLNEKLLILQSKASLFKTVNQLFYYCIVTKCYCEQAIEYRHTSYLSNVSSLYTVFVKYGNS